MTGIARFLLVAGALAASAGVLSSQTPAGYRLVKTIPVGGEGGWDYAIVDGHRLYVSHATRLVVIDVDRDTVVGEVPNTAGIHGAAIATDLGRGFTSNGRDTSVTIFDLQTLAVIDKVKVTGANPDAIHYDVATQRVFTFNGTGHNATALDAKSGAVLGTIPLGGKPEFAQTDGKGLLYVNIETDTGQIVVIDTRSLKEVKRYWLPGCESPTGLALDRGSRRLFSACGNSVMVASDPATGTIVQSIPIGPGADAAAYDPQTKLVFASNGGDGTVSIAHQDDADHYTLLGHAPTQRASRTMALDPRTHKLYLSAARYGPAPAPATPGARPGRAPMLPGSFSVLVLEKH